MLVCVALMPHASFAQSIPPHLAGTAAVLYKSAEKNLKDYSAEDPAQKQAADVTLQTLGEMNVKVYATKPIVIGEPIRKLEQSLGYAAGDSRTPDLVQNLWPLPHEKAQETIQNLLGENGTDRSKRLDDAMAALSDARSGSGLATSSSITLSDGRSVTIQWLPVTGDADVTVASDGSGSIPEFSTTLEGEMALAYDKDSGSFTLMPEPADEAPDIATAATLEARRASIIGEWQIDGAGKIIVTAASEEDGNVARSRQDIENEIGALQKQRESIKNQNLYVWKNARNGREQRQEKFRRLDEPWNYVGELPKADNLPQKLAEIDTEIAALNNELAAGAPPAVRQDPVGFNRVKAYPRARRLDVTYVEADNCTLAMDEAWFDGKNLAARTTLKDVCATGAHLPQPIRAKLISGGWNPPMWLLAKVSSTQENQVLTLDFSEHGMLVTYNPDEFTISGIKEPHLTLSRVARREEAINQKYSVASSALP